MHYPLNTYSRRLNRGSILQAQLLDRLLAHQELLNLAGYRHREIVHKLEVARHFIMSNLALTEHLQFILGKLLTGLDLHPCHDLFTVLDIRHTNHLHVADLGMGVQELFNLTRVDILAAANDHVLNTSYDVDVALAI